MLFWASLTSFLINLENKPVAHANRESENVIVGQIGSNLPFVDHGRRASSLISHCRWLEGFPKIRIETKSHILSIIG
jgi:hypothetical protein